MAAVRPMQLEVGLDGSTRPLAGTGAVCSHVDCFKPALQSRVHASGTVIMAVTNAGFAAFWHNLRCSLERVGLAQHALVVGTDRDACSAALAPGVHCLVGESLFWPEEAAAELDRKAVSHGTRPYARLMQVKARPTLEALRLGFNVLTTDTDVVFLRDPLAHLAALSRDGEEPLHVLIQSDHDESNEAQCSRHAQCPRSHWCDERAGRCDEEVCGGFHWMRAAAQHGHGARLAGLGARLAGLGARLGQPRAPAARGALALAHAGPLASRAAPGAHLLRSSCSLGALPPMTLVSPRVAMQAPESIALLGRMFDLFEQQRSGGDERTGEQPALNHAIRRTHGLRFRALPRELYPNGATFFSRGMRPPSAALPYAVHNNWIAGFEAKRRRFEEHAMWLTRTTPETPYTCVSTALHATPPS